MAEVSLYTLPIELIHHILGNLDVKTVLSSFRNVCKRFYTIVNNYNRYELDFSSISKIDFHHVCSIIRPEHIISLTLSDNDMTPGQICLFMSLFNIDQLIHLRSLSLIQIDKSELSALMERININVLSSLSIDIRKNNSKSNDTSLISLLSNITMANLRKLDLCMWSHEINNIVWPKQYTLRHLTLGHYITLKQVCKILSQSVHLRTLVLRNCIVNNTDESIMAFSDVEQNTNLISLTFKNSRLYMDELELLLSLTPSIVHLQLTGGVSLSDAILDGSRWEQFIQVKLPSLEKFEFFFRAKANTNHSPADIELWIVPFRTKFWLNRSWYVTCNYIIKTTTLRLYSVPICDPCIIYESEFDQIAFTTCTTIDNDASIMNNVREVQLDLVQMMTAVTTQKVCYEKKLKRIFLNLHISCI
jgi:hypothetical protein